MLKATKRAQQTISKNRRTKRCGRKKVVNGVRSATRIEFMHLDDFHALALECQSDLPAAEIGSRFGLSVDTVDVTRQLIAKHVARSTRASACGLAPMRTNTPSERRAYRQLFKRVSQSILVLSPEKSADIGCILGQVDGFNSPIFWSESGIRAVRRLISDARAGAAKLNVEATVDAPAKTSAQSARFRLAWSPLACGTDLNAHWLPIVVLALLRSRAAFLAAAKN